MATVENRKVVLSIIKLRDISFTSFTSKTEAQGKSQQET